MAVALFWKRPAFVLSVVRKPKTTSVTLMVLQNRLTSFNTGTGWYVYNTDESDWKYYCSADDKSSIGEVLWYNEDEYRARTTDGDIYGAYEYLSTWEPDGFETTSWYHNAESHEDAYEDQKNDSNDSNDSDYDWDSGDSWDSGGTDWDSDW